MTTRASETRVSEASDARASLERSNSSLQLSLTNDSYVILIGTKRSTERYCRDKDGWLKVSARGRTFRMTAEQVLNHLLPVVAGLRPSATLKVEHQPPRRLGRQRHGHARASTGPDRRDALRPDPDLRPARSAGRS